MKRLYIGYSSFLMKLHLCLIVSAYSFFIFHSVFVIFLVYFNHFKAAVSVVNWKLCRFGIDSVCGPDEMAKAEELKRKARAERFFSLLYSIV